MKKLRDEPAENFRTFFQPQFDTNEIENCWKIPIEPRTDGDDIELKKKIFTFLASLPSTAIKTATFLHAVCVSKLITFTARLLFISESLFLFVLNQPTCCWFDCENYEIFSTLELAYVSLEILFCTNWNDCAAKCTKTLFVMLFIGFADGGAHCTRILALVVAFAAIVLVSDRNLLQTHLISGKVVRMV